MNRFIHCPNADGSVDSSPAFESPWWTDKGLHVGMLTRKTRGIKLLNMLTKQETVLEVCAEETLNEIRCAPRAAAHEHMLWLVCEPRPASVHRQYAHPIALFRSQATLLAAQRARRLVLVETSR
jgi:hypothetical protein